MKRLSLIVLVLFSLTALLSGNVITVDLAGGGDFSSIHEAVAAAASGDTILVMSGQYDFTTSNGRITVSKQLFIIGSGFDKVENGGTKLVDINATGLFLLDASSDGTVIKGFRISSGVSAITTEPNAKRIVIENNFR